MKHLSLLRIAIASLVAVASFGCASHTESTSSTPPAATSTAQNPTGQPPATPATAPAATTPTTSAAPVVVLNTSMGEIDIELDPKNAPISTANFLAYVDKKFYDGTIFHRIIPGFVVQGGGFNPDMSQKPTDPPIKNEATNGLKNLRGTISMARTSDPDSATSQFFLNLVDNAALDPNPQNPAGYAVFGHITKGLDVIDKMAAVETTTVGPNENVPVKPVTLITATRQ